MLKKLNNLINNWPIPTVLKSISLVVFVGLMIAGLMANSSDPNFIKQLRNTNVGNLMVWSYWWPIIIILAIFAGRIWCMMCPVELITSFFAKIGMKKKRPQWLLSGWAITIFYLFILIIGIQGFAIHRNPFFMAVYLLTITGVSIVVGTVFEKNTFCRYVCPVGYLLGLYSKLSFIGWRVKNTDLCLSCKDKSCIHKEYRYNLGTKSCGVDLIPANVNDNAHCILCAGCLKTCSKYQATPDSNKPNPQLTYIGFAHDLFQLKPLKAAEMVFVMVVSGFVISEIWSEWSPTEAYLNYLPNYITDLFSINYILSTNIIKGMITFGLIPLILWAVPYVTAKISGAAITVKDYLLNYSLAFIPIIAAAHLCKALLKSTSRIPYLKYIHHDWTGLTTAEKIINGDINLIPNPEWLNTMVSVILTVTMITGIWISTKVVKMINQQQPKHNALTFNLIPIIYGSIFLIMILIWRWYA
jgi:hypothetical protein